MSNMNVPSDLDIYLKKLHRIKETQAELYKLKLEIKPYEEKAVVLLTKLPKNKYVVLENEHYGERGMLRISKTVRREYLSLKAINIYILQYLQEKFKDQQSEESLIAFGTELSEYLWNVRRSTTVEKLERTISTKNKKRKKAAGVIDADDDNDDDDNDDEDDDDEDDELNNFERML